jgi:H+/gluconate symporter-like permease
MVGSEDKKVLGYMNEGIKSVVMILLVTGAGGSIS